jgi:hypothetical protein
MIFFKRADGVAAVAAVAAFLASSTAYATDVTPLPAGKPAGTHEAALLALGPIFWIGLAAIGLGIGLAVSQGNGNSTLTTTTTGTSA